MKLPVALRSAADRDVDAIRDFLERESPSAERKFSGRLDKLLVLLTVFPYLAGKVWRSVRAATVKGFKYVVYYVVLRTRVEVIAVMHGSRSPSAWKDRL